MGAPRKLVTSQKEEHPDEKEDKPYEIEKILQKRIIAGGIVRRTFKSINFF